VSGKVYIVGAGPGDIGLLTVKGLMCLKKADVVVYDFHLNAQVLNYIKHDAEFIYAGKRGGHHEMTQEEINRTLIEKAKAGKIVCRLKGGDPFVFGRGGEEAECLAREGIEFEVIPGVSSAIAVPAYAGIPLTHRLYSSSVTIVPGNEGSSKKQSTIRWEQLSKGPGTLVFLMAVRNISYVCQKLIENGRDPDTPVAVIRWGTRADQTTIEGRLRGIPDLVKEKDIKPPAVMVVGDVVRLRQDLKWFENKPLFGHRILVTREHSGGFEPLEDLGAEIIEFSTIKIVPPQDWAPLDRAIKNIETYHWLILTSANGVKFFFDRLFFNNRDIRDLKGIKICCIGSKTEEAIRKYGIRVDLVPEKFNAEGLIQTFMEYYNTQGHEDAFKGVRFLLPRAEVARDIFPDTVRKLGGEIDVVTAYRTVKPETHGKRLKRFLKEGKITIATFTSAATFKNFLDIAGDDARELLSGVSIAAIGPVTARAIEKAGLKVDIMPGEATIEAMVREIILHKARPSGDRT